MALCMRKGRTVQLYGPDQSTRHAPAVAWRVSAEIVVVEFNERTTRTCKQLRQTKKKDRHAGSRARTPFESCVRMYLSSIMANEKEAYASSEPGEPGKVERRLAF
uniref:Uncharacterized protein n=1 Tax=Oryza meridionalis TaxID=40149 RepID=A0A0E0CPK1_9ORYZ